VFISAGIMRIIFQKDAYIEKKKLFPFIPYFEKILPLFEIILGLLLFTEYCYISLYIFAIGIVVYTIRIFWIYHKNILKTLNEVCTYRDTTTHVVLHITYFIIIIYLINS
jgi:hypothetical protein